MAEARMAMTGVRVDAGMSLQRFIDEIFFAHRHTAYPVVMDGETVGLISFRDALPVPRDQWPRVLVRERTRPRDEVLVVDAARDLAESPSWRSTRCTERSCWSAAAQPACSR
ncbi:MAG: Zinc metalloprotease [Solirubrobacterales bacterium]|nr:Zinc metalloprotease [Solirubrobacterales bacterium]